MKKLTILALFLVMTPVAMGEVSTRVCLADANTPLELADPNIPFIYRDIMVGTKLTIIIESNNAEQWDGGLFIAGIDRDYGVLSGRDYNDTTLDWEGSRFEAAGDGARVYDWLDVIQSGFDFYGHRSAVAGDWFIIDYNATSVGNCNVGFYDYGGPGGMDFPAYDLVFSHVRTRDFNNDAVVDFNDFAVLASHWQETGCSDPNWCEGTDLDIDGNVDCNDLILFIDYWLERTEFYEELPAGTEYDLKSVKEVGYRSDSEIRAVIKDASLLDGFISAAHYQLFISDKLQPVLGDGQCVFADSV